MSSKFLKPITQILLLSVVAVVPFLFTKSLYFPYVSGKVYLFRLLVALAFFFWAWLMLKEKASGPNFKNLLVIALVLFFLAQVLVSFLGVDPVYSFFSSIERGDGVLQYGFWILYFLMLISVFKSKKDWQIFLSVFLITALVISVYAWLNYKEQIRLHGIFGNSSYLAVFLLFAIGFCAIAIERRFFKDIFLKTSVVLAIAFFIFTLIFTQTRGAYVGLAGGISLFCFLSTLFLRKKNKKLALFCGIALAVGLIATIALFSARETDFVKSRYILQHTTSIAKLWQDDVVRERLLTWQIALKALKERPVFGYGPENFASAFNKYYDYRIGMVQPWFDRAHSQPLDTLATGGIVLFSFYLFWIGVVIYLIFKISREKKILSFILASTFLAYLLQGLFLFDTLPTYLGLFPFLGFLVFQSYELRIGTNIQISDESRGQKLKEKQNTKYKIQTTSCKILVPVGIFSLFIIYATCFIPYRANASTLKFYAFTENGLYKVAELFLEEAFNIKSPYTFWEVRKRAGWQFLNVLDYGLKDKTGPDDIRALKDIYDFITPELEKFAENKPYDPQIYFILGRMYRFGFEKLGYNDLDKAERILKKGFNYSDLRVEYLNELDQVLLLEEKFEEAEKFVKDYIGKVNFDEYFPYVTLGHFYFVAGKYDLAMEQYEKAREAGYKFYENTEEYSRFLSVAEKSGEYQKVVDMALVYLEKWGPDADTFFNIAVGYLNLGEKEKAREFFLKAVELKKDYEEYRSFFTQ